MTQQKRTSIANILVIFGLSLMLFMAMLPLFIHHMESKETMRWIYAVGAFIVLAARLIGYNNDGSLRVKRLYRILIFSGLLFCASATVMFFPDISKNWVAFLLAGLIMQIYASWMIDHESKKIDK